MNNTNLFIVICVSENPKHHHYLDYYLGVKRTSGVNETEIKCKPHRCGWNKKHFSNSLIIHQVKTKEITTVKEVWIPDLNRHRFWRFYFSVYSLVFASIEKIYQTLETVFHRLSKQREFCQKYSAARRIFGSLLGVWISRWNTVSRVWYITSSKKDMMFDTFPNAEKRVEYMMHSGDFWQTLRCFENLCGQILSWPFNIYTFLVESKAKEKLQK